jgi:hypothetical protein
MPVVAQTGTLKHRLITQRIDKQKLVTLYGSTRPEVNTKNDRGPSPGTSFKEPQTPGSNYGECI